MTATRSFRCQPEAVTAARRFVRDALSDQSLEVVQAAELMTSELATNCVRHARTDFELSVHSRDEIRIEVRDTGDGRPRPLSPAPQDPSGRGLLIVEAMSEQWGVIPASSGKTVWFTLPKPGTSSESSRLAATRRRGTGEDDRPGQAGSGEGSGRRPAARRAPRATVRGEASATRVGRRRRGRRPSGRCASRAMPTCCASPTDSRPAASWRTSGSARSCRRESPRR